MLHIIRNAVQNETILRTEQFQNFYNLDHKNHIFATGNMMDSKIEALLLLLVLMKHNHAQLTTVITSRGYNASLDPEASFTFQCDVTGTI